MSLKPDYKPTEYDTSRFMNETASPGVIVSTNTAGSGVALDQTDNTVTVAGATSGANPVGLLLDEVVDLDLTRTPVNWHKRQANIGDKVSVMKKGWAVTDQVVNATNGKQAVLASSGSVTNRADGDQHDEHITPTVGRFLSGKDQGGYAKVYVDL